MILVDLLYHHAEPPSLEYTLVSFHLETLQKNGSEWSRRERSFEGTVGKALTKTVALHM